MITTFPGHEKRHLIVSMTISITLFFPSFWETGITPHQRGLAETANRRRRCRSPKLCPSMSTRTHGTTSTPTRKSPPRPVAGSLGDAASRRPTFVQQHTIPILLSRCDLMACTTRPPSALPSSTASWRVCLCSSLNGAELRHRARSLSFCRPQDSYPYRWWSSTSCYLFC
jgi:hypothetical protein